MLPMPRAAAEPPPPYDLPLIIIAASGFARFQLHAADAISAYAHFPSFRSRCQTPARYAAMPPG